MTKEKQYCNILIKENTDTVLEARVDFERHLDQDLLREPDKDTYKVNGSV